VEIAYIVDNERVTTTQQVDLTAADASVVGNVGAAPPGGAAEPGDGGPPLRLIGGVVVVVGVALGLGLYRWRSQ
jgi:hypothetical protein